MVAAWIAGNGLSQAEVQRLSAEVMPLAEYDEGCNLVRAKAWSDELESMRMLEAVNQNRPRQ